MWWSPMRRRFVLLSCFFFFFSSRRRHTRFDCDWSSDVCSSDLTGSCLCYADCSVTHDQSAVKVHGVFPSRCGHPASSPEPQIRRAVRQDSRSIIPPFVQVGTYPTRNFARFLLLCFQRSRTFSFASCVHY